MHEVIVLRRNSSQELSIIQSSSRSRTLSQSKSSRAPSSLFPASVIDTQPFEQRTTASHIEAQYEPQGV